MWRALVVLLFAQGALAEPAQCGPLTNSVFAASSDVSNYLFYKCHDILGAEMSADVTRIGDFSFYQCTLLGEVILSDGLQIIGHSAFSHTRISEITIPNTVTFIGNAAFSENYYLENVTIGSSLGELPTAMLYDCMPLFNVDLGNVTTIGDSSFQYSSISTLALPLSVVEIGEYAFDSSEIHTINIPPTVTYIGDYAFYNAHHLQNLTIAPGIDNAGYRSFDSSITCSSTYLTDLLSLISPSGPGVCNCMSCPTTTSSTTTATATSSTLTVSTTTVSTQTITSTSSTTADPITGFPGGCPPYYRDSLVISDSSLSYMSCQTLRNVTYSANNFSTTSMFRLSSIEYIDIVGSVHRIPENTFEGSLLMAFDFTDITNVGSGSFLNCGLSGRIDLPNVTDIESFAFGSTDITEVDASQASIIKAFAFYDCKLLQSVTLSSALTIIAESVFEGAVLLSAINIPQSVGEIQANAFLKSDLRSIMFYGNTVIDMNAFADTPCTVRIPNPMFERDVQTGIWYGKNTSNCSRVGSSVPPLIPGGFCSEGYYERWTGPIHDANNVKCFPCTQCLSYKRLCGGETDSICKEPENVKRGFILMIILYGVYSVSTVVFYLSFWSKKEKID